MPDLSAFPITRRWPAEHPDRLQLYSPPTPCGVKVSIMSVEIGLPSEPHRIDIASNMKRRHLVWTQRGYFLTTGI
jgi:GST-like protein